MELDQRDSRTVTASAHLALEQWAARLGAPADPEPGLLAVLDQHMARIATAVGSLTPVNLAAYADGVADAAASRGWAPSPVRDWRQASWVGVHLLAVCVLARSVS
jgi:Family of unknown function (DUF6401)